jgi:hypothetical protein
VCTHCNVWSHAPAVPDALFSPSCTACLTPMFLEECDSGAFNHVPCSRRAAEGVPGVYLWGAPWAHRKAWRVTCWNESRRTSARRFNDCAFWLGKSWAICMALIALGPYLLGVPPATTAKQMLPTTASSIALFGYYLLTDDF